MSHGIRSSASNSLVLRLRWKTTLFVAILGAAATLVVALPASAASSYIVVLTPTAKVNTVLKNYQVSPTNVYHAAINGFAAPLTQDQITRLEKDPVVASITPDSSFSFASKPPPPPPQQQPQQVKNWSRRVGGPLSPTAKIDGIDERVDVDVAILDTGIQPDHPDLNVVGGVDCGSGQGWADQSGHGTMVAGIVGALDNQIDVVGIAPGARLWAVRVMGRNGTGSESAVLCGIDWVTAHANIIDVANMSLGFTKHTDTGNCGFGRSNDRDPLHQALCASVAAGVTFVVSAGNDAQDAANQTPAAYPEVITVSAMADYDGQPGGLAPTTCSDQTDDTFATFSNFGAAVDLAAPGVCITSTYIGSQLAFGDGTSFASPIVSGAAALYKATHPSATADQVRAALISLAESGPIPGDPDSYGEGIVNVSTL